MALNDILTSMDGARDALVTAINAKGGSLADNATLYQCAAAVSNISTGTDTQEPVLLSPTNVTEETLALNTATNSYGTWNFSASNKASGYEPSALFMESYDNFTFGTESTHWLLVECTNTFAPESLYFYAGGSNVLGYTPKTLEIYGISNGADYLLGTATLVSTDKDKNGLSNTVEATIELNHGGRTYNSIKILQTSNQTGTSVQAIWRKIEIRGYDHAVAAPCSAEYYKCASVDTSAKTWSGYKAVQQENGGYTFEETVTTGLAYTSVTPVVGGIYSADALVKVEYLYTSALFFDGFTFEDQLASTNGYLSLEESPTPVYVEHDNGKALSFDGSGGRELTGFDFIKNEFKIEFDFKIDSWSTDSSWKGNASRIFGAGVTDNTVFTFEAYKSNGEIKTCGFYTGFIVQLATWHHASVEYKNNKLTVTFDSNTVSFDYNPDLSAAQTCVDLGGSTFDNFYLLTGAIDNFNLYTFKA